MPATLTIRDETTTGQVVQEWTLDFLTERVSVRELIRGRVYQEVQDHNLERAAPPFRGLVQPGADETAVNGPPKERTPRPIDWHKQFAVAQDAFENGRVLILIGDRQADSLDEEIEVRPDTVVTFLRLVPLVG